MPMSGTAIAVLYRTRGTVQHYEATIDDYLRVLDAHGIGQAVLVQPSFLGTDNRYLLSALSAHPDRLRGIVVLDPDTSDAELDDMTGAGVIGHRFNLLSLDPALLQTAQYRTLTERANGRGWWTEIQAPGPIWCDVAPLMGELGAKLMVDHFALSSGPNCAGIAALARLHPAQVSVKFSAPYRQTHPAFLDAIQPLVTDKHPLDPLWGSDWPWTQHEGHHSYADCIAWLKDWRGESGTRNTHATARALGF